MMSRHYFIVRSFLYSRVTGDSLLFGRFLWRRSSKELFFGDDSRVCGGLPPNELVSLSRVGRKLAEEQGAYVLRYHREGVGGVWWGAMVVIACSTCLNSSHIHLGPSFTLDCFYKRAPARQNFSRNVF